MRNWNKKLVREWEAKSSLCDMWRRKWCAQIHFCWAVVSIYFSQHAEWESAHERKKKKATHRGRPPGACLRWPTFLWARDGLIGLLFSPSHPPSSRATKIVLLLRLALRTETKNFHLTNTKNILKNVFLLSVTFILYLTCACDFRWWEKYIILQSDKNNQINWSQNLSVYFQF